jgi:hypothetical protein
VAKEGPHAHPFFFPRQGREAGAATVELAALLPFLCFLFVAAVDYARALVATPGAPAGAASPGGKPDVQL